MQPLTIHSWPQAILHVDADAFFASCEQALTPQYKGKPVVTGKERGIIACPSYEAKVRGVKRAMTIIEAKKLCPDLIVLPSDYETYSLFSKRMTAIIKEFTPMVEKYSIDEMFADITGLRKPLHGSYEEIAKRIKEKIEKELGITVSIGLSLTKSLTKLASKFKKPAGLTIIPGRKIHLLLKITPLEKVWGFGPNITAYLEKLGLKTALDFAKQSEYFTKKHLGKIGLEIWKELHGEMVYPVRSEEKESYQSIMKSKTFTPASNKKEFVYAQILRNLESACIKARRYHLAAQKIIVFLKTQNFKAFGYEIKLSRVSAHPLELSGVLRQGFEKLFSPRFLYRSTGVILTHLQSNGQLQTSLFDDPLKIEKAEKISLACDKINQRFGKHTLSLAATLPLLKYKQHQGERGDIPKRKTILLKGETKRQRLNLPLIFLKV